MKSFLTDPWNMIDILSITRFCLDPKICHSCFTAYLIGIKQQTQGPGASSFFEVLRQILKVHMKQVTNTYQLLL